MNDTLPGWHPSLWPYIGTCFQMHVSGMETLWRRLVIRKKLRAYRRAPLPYLWEKSANNVYILQKCTGIRP